MKNGYYISVSNGDMLFSGTKLVDAMVYQRIKMEDCKSGLKYKIVYVLDGAEHEEYIDEYGGEMRPVLEGGAVIFEESFWDEPHDFAYWDRLVEFERYDLMRQDFGTWSYWVQDRIEDQIRSMDYRPFNQAEVSYGDCKAHLNVWGYTHDHDWTINRVKTHICNKMRGIATYGCPAEIFVVEKNDDSVHLRLEVDLVN